MPKTPLDYRNEVGTVISLEEAQALDRPLTISPIQQESMISNHRVYHLPYHTLFRLSSIGFLPKWLLEFQNKPPLCVAYQFSQAHCRPWRAKGKKSVSIQTPEQINPSDGVSVDHIVSEQPCLIPQISGFLTNQRLWGATTFLDHVSDYVYIHLMQDLYLEDKLLAK